MKEPLASTLRTTLSNSNNTLRQRILACFSLPIAFFIFLPLNVYVFNLDSVAISRGSILLIGGVATITLSTILFILFSVRTFGPALLALSQLLALFIFFATIFPNSTGDPTGLFDKQNLSLAPKDAAKAIAFMLASGLLLLYRRNTFDLFINSALVLMLFSSAFIAIAFQSNAELIEPEVENVQPSANAESEELIGLGSQSNIIVLVLDTFTGYRALEILKRDQGLASAFNGFTLFPRALSPALSTPAGISTILTGSIDISLGDHDDLTRGALSLDTSFLADAAELGYSIACITPLRMTGKKVPCSQESILVPNGESGFHSLIDSYAIYTVVSANRIFPPLVVSYLGKIASAISSLTNANDKRDAAMLRDIGLADFADRVPLTSRMALNYFSENLHISPNVDHKIIFFHSKISHGPWHFNKNGDYDLNFNSDLESSVYALKMSANLLGVLKHLDSYDNSSILIVADHGGINVEDRSMGGVFEPDARLDVWFNPLLMMKPKNATGDLQVSNTTVWLGDIFPTVQEMLRQNHEGSSSISLLREQDLDREITMPLFTRASEDQRRHSGLKDWNRIEAQGTFADYGRIFAKARADRRIENY